MSKIGDMKTIKIFSSAVVDDKIAAARKHCKPLDVFLAEQLHADNKRFQAREKMPNTRSLAMEDVQFAKKRQSLQAVQIVQGFNDTREKKAIGLLEKCSSLMKRLMW